MTDHIPQLAHLEYLGDAARFASQIHALIPKSALLENFTPAEVRQLSHFMDVYRAAEGQEVIHEGDGGDFMLIVVEGRFEVRKQDRWNTPQPIIDISPSEMSMIDGEPRFATCVALEPTLVAVLGRENLARIIVEEPLIGAKILMELVLMLSQRLRATSSRLMELLDEQGQHSAGHL
jgi:CRP/FNR family transcriptional regulator, cyclic AMP receptor protein